MSQLVVFIAGLLLVAESQASDVADRSTLQGFLPKYDKFITPNFNSAKPQVQDLPKIADREAEQAVQKLPAIGSNDPVSLSIFGIGLVSFVTMLGLTLRRALQPATIPTNSGGLGLDMPMMEMKSQDSHKMSSSRVGWGQLSSQNTSPSTLCYAMETKADLEAIAKSLNPVVGYYDPLNVCGDSKLGQLGLGYWADMYDFNSEQTIAWYRQAEIKHGRVAMAAFVGYIVQANGYHWSTKMTLGGADWPTGTPPEQWDALPAASKWQIILFVGMLEAFDEQQEPHYMKGRMPGEYPKFSKAYKEGTGFPHPVPFDLFDPFGTVEKFVDTPEKRARGRAAEINNGRLAMLGMFGFMAASKVPGSVPALTDIIPAYNGDYMVPFEGNFNVFFVSPEKPSQNTRPSTLCNATETKADLEAIAKSLNPVVGYWDPLNVGGASQSLYSFNNEQTIAWYRQAEIKHGRIAMAAFVGYCVQANGIHWSTKMTLGGADWPTGTPPEQWDALPVASKWQIILFVGMLELFDESIEPHYMMGRKPGEYPKFSKAYMEGRGFPHPVPFDLFDPFGTVEKILNTPEKRARGRLVEINNGRLAMLGIFGFLAASKVPGSVPALTDIIPPYSGEYMVPFEGNFHLGGM